MISIEKPLLARNLAMAWSFLISGQSFLYFSERHLIFAASAARSSSLSSVPQFFFHCLLDDVLRNAVVFQLEDGLEATDASRFKVVDVGCGELRVIQQPSLQQVIDDSLDILRGEFAGVEELPFEGRHGMRAVFKEAEGFFTAVFKGVGGHAGENRAVWEA